MNKLHEMVGYQIYPKSFKDSNGDGIGDINGIIEKLPYLKDLGIDFIWINPLYKSPQVDGGYDISDFYAIDEMFGSLADFKNLLTQAHALNIKILMDLVVNHSSDQHPWFKSALESKDSIYRDYYLWQDAKDAQIPPNNWKSFFGGSAWEYDEASGQSYFHVFAKEQPDLNWANPKLREEIYKMIRFWLDLGVDGFRLDAISHIKKEPWNFEIKSWTGDGPWMPFMNVSGIEEYLLDLKNIFKEYGAITVGEASGVSSKQASSWTGDDGHFDMIFELAQNTRKNKKGHVYGFKKVMIEWQENLQEDGWNALYLENHDNPRVIDMFGDGSKESAKALAVAYMLLRGTPFIYQGQEIGMKNFPFSNITQVQSAEIVGFYDKLIDDKISPELALEEITWNSREHSRTPMQWDMSAYSGFSNVAPWFEINPNYPELNVENSQELLELYKLLIDLRHKEELVSNGQIEFFYKKHLQAFVYKRFDKAGNELIVMANLGLQNAHLKFELSKEETYEQILGSRPNQMKDKMQLKAWEYQVFKKCK